MLDKEKFNLTIKDAKDISCALDACIKIRKIEQMNFTINTSKDNNTLKILYSHPLNKNPNAYPLSVIMQMIIYKMENLNNPDNPDDPFVGLDGSSIKGYEIEGVSSGLKILKTYFYAGK